jgi:hypothetical protein
MKKTILFMLSIMLLVNNMLCNELNKATPSALTSEEYQSLDLLRCLIKFQPFFIEDDNFKINYCLNILEKRIQILEHKIYTKESICKSSVIFLGITEIFMGIICSLLTYSPEFSSDEYLRYIPLIGFLLTSLYCVNQTYNDITNYPEKLAQDLQYFQQIKQKFNTEQKRRQLEGTKVQRLWFSPNKTLKLLYDPIDWRKVSLIQRFTTE